MVMETTVPVASKVAVTRHSLKNWMLDLLQKVVDGASTMRYVIKSLAIHPCSLVCSKSSVPTLCTERLDSRTRKRDTRNGLCEMQQLDVSAIVLNMYSQNAVVLSRGRFARRGPLGGSNGVCLSSLGAARRGLLGGPDAVCFEVLHGGSL